MCPDTGRADRTHLSFVRKKAPPLQAGPLRSGRAGVPEADQTSSKQEKAG